MKMTDSIIATILVENTVSVPDLKGEHGFSVLVQTPGGNILWDTGQSPLFIENMVKMGLDIKSIDHVALSHGHYDHVGGLRSLLTLNTDLNIYCHPELFKKRFSRKKKNGLSIRCIGSPVSREYVETHCRSLRLERRMSEVLPGIFLTGEIPRVSKTENTGGDFFDDAACAEADSVPDDQAMFIHSKKGIIVFLGCAHAGIINTLNHIALLTGERNIYAVFGGMHLKNASDERLKETADILNNFNIEVIGPCHCTGSRAQAFFRSLFPGRIAECETGSRYFFESS